MREHMHEAIFKNSFFVIIFAFFAACQAPTTNSPELSKQEVSNEEFNQQRMVDEVIARGGKPKAWRNQKNMRGQFEAVGEIVEKAGAQICVESHLQRNGCYYFFRLLRDEDINAKADGKNIIIYTGMMRFVENDDELAAVMAHEFAHNLMGHIKAQSKNATYGKLLGMALDAIVDSQGLSSDGEITEVAEGIGISTYSIDYEKEADYIGMYVLARAGYDLSKAGSLWRRMSIEDPDAIYSSSTHPSNPERFVALQKTIYEINYKRKHHLPLVPDFKQ